MTYYKRYCLPWAPREFCSHTTGFLGPMPVFLWFFQCNWWHLRLTFWFRFLGGIHMEWQAPCAAYSATGLPEQRAIFRSGFSIFGPKEHDGQIQVLEQYTFIF